MTTGVAGACSRTSGQWGERGSRQVGVWGCRDAKSRWVTPTLACHDEALTLAIGMVPGDLAVMGLCCSIRIVTSTLVLVKTDLCKNLPLVLVKTDLKRFDGKALFDNIAHKESNNYLNFCFQLCCGGLVMLSQEDVDYDTYPNIMATNTEVNVKQLLSVLPYCMRRPSPGDMDGNVEAYKATRHCHVFMIMLRPTRLHHIVMCS